MGSCSVDVEVISDDVITSSKGESSKSTCEKPLLLMEFTSDDNGDGQSRIRLHKEVFASLVDKAGGRVVSIFCTSGPRGVGFMLDYMRRRLEALENGEDNGNWMRADGSPGLPELAPGIWIWSRPFIVKNEDGKEVAVLLMDAQGVFDDFVNCKEKKVSPIMALSLLTSSVMICNLLPAVNEDLIDCLSTYTNYGNLVINQTNCTPFQRLVLLIRDWIQPEEYPFGWSGGKQFLEATLKVKPNQTVGAKQTRESIEKCFEQLNCFLMPDIGEQAVFPDFSGSIDELGPEMAEMIKEVVNGLINRGALATKKILGNEVTAEDMLPYLESYIDIFNSRENPSAEDLWKTTHSTYLSQLVKRAPPKLNELIEEKLLSTHLKFEIGKFFSKVKQEVDEAQCRMEQAVRTRLKAYGKEMQTILESKEFMSEADLEDAHKRLMEKALMGFEKTEKMPDNVEDFKTKLKNGILQQFDTINKENTAKREATEVEAKNCVKQSYESYLNTLKNQVKTLHEKAVRKSKQTFLEQCPAKELPQFVKEHETQLEELISTTFETLSKALSLVDNSPQHRQDEKARSLMEECAQAAITQLRSTFPERVKFWIKNVLHPDSIPEMRAVYSETLNGIVEEYRDIVSPNLWSNFIIAVNELCKVECMSTLETISELVGNLNDCLQKHVLLWDKNVSITPTDRRQICKSELQKLKVAVTYDALVLEMVYLANDRLLEIYDEQACQKIATSKINQALGTYEEKMQTYLDEDTLYSQETFKQIHRTLVDNAVTDLQSACSAWNKADILTKKENVLKSHLFSAFIRHNMNNESKLEKRKTLIDKILNNSKKQYIDRMWEVLNKNPDGLETKSLETFHITIQSEVLKLFEMEIRQKIGLDEPLEKHMSVLEAHRDLYWLEIVNLNKENTKKKQLKKEREESMSYLKQELLQKCTQMEAKLTYSSARLQPYVTKKISGAREIANNTESTSTNIQECITKLDHIALKYNLN